MQTRSLTKPDLKQKTPTVLKRFKISYDKAFNQVMISASSVEDVSPPESRLSYELSSPEKKQVIQNEKQVVSNEKPSVSNERQIVANLEGETLQLVKTYKGDASGKKKKTEIVAIKPAEKKKGKKGKKET